MTGKERTFTSTVTHVGQGGLCIDNMCGQVGSDFAPRQMPSCCGCSNSNKLLRYPYLYATVNFTVCVVTSKSLQQTVLPGKGCHSRFCFMQNWLFHSTVWSDTIFLYYDWLNSQVSPIFITCSFSIYSKIYKLM